jgi:hypothetical protein
MNKKMSYDESISVATDMVVKFKHTTSKRWLMNVIEAALKNEGYSADELVDIIRLHEVEA